MIIYEIFGIIRCIIIVCVLFYVNIFDKTKSPFTNDIFTDLVSTSDFNVNFKGHLNGICQRFLLIFKQNSDANS